MTSLLGPAFGVRDYRRWWVATLATFISLQMIDVAIGWQIYAEHHKTLYLGLVGLLEFAPIDTVTAIMANDIKALIKSPYKNWLWLTLKLMCEKSGA